MSNRKNFVFIKYLKIFILVYLLNMTAFILFHGEAGLLFPSKVWIECHCQIHPLYSALFDIH